MIAKLNCVLTALSVVAQPSNKTSKVNRLVNAVRAFFIFFSSFGPNVLTQSVVRLVLVACMSTMLHLCNRSGHTLKSLPAYIPFSIVREAG